MPRTREYRHGELVAEDFPVAEVPERLRGDGVTLWVDLCGPSTDELPALAAELGLHALAVEDALHPHERPKLHQYETHCFLTAYATRLDEQGALVTAELSAFVTRHALVTVRTDDRFDMGLVVDRWEESPTLARSGVGYLAHGLLDCVVDSHFEAVQALDEQIESLEDMVFADQPDTVAVQRRSLALRRSLVTLRRVVLPMREVVSGLMRRDQDIVDAPLMPYYQDVYDHVLRAGEWTESLREVVATIRETQLSLQGNRLNLVMKKVTGWAAIVAVPTAITGFYGQNVPFPGTGETWGFWLSAALMLVASASLYLLFKRRDWL
ncbi:magnesium transporter CorA family protein [Saccharothrix obliqua]|uniref:magnesium transporter CorA family protein n=1 Tax=Saccharothrix obliqua TaxID=2861747 RepID=UPI001C5FA401|nr:magnesium transporter CorA family protein [Saccharothrix obliqua]MBW4718422.1 magnesium transporter CorA family protein [Saccharothrix obliqua]